MEMYNCTTEKLEEYCDTAKLITVTALFNAGLLNMDEQDADKWCASHTVLLRTKTLFRSIFKKREKQPEDYHPHRFLVVKRVYPPDEKEPDPE